MTPSRNEARKAASLSYGTAAPVSEVSHSAASSRRLAPLSRRESLAVRLKLPRRGLLGWLPALVGRAAAGGAAAGGVKAKSESGDAAGLEAGEGAKSETGEAGAAMSLCSRGQHVKNGLLMTVNEPSARQPHLPLAVRL